MDYEKLYKETIDKLRKLHNDWNSTQNRAAKEIESVFPELRESEDERIMKGLIEHLKELKEQSVEGSHLKRPEHYDAWIALLEKQGEQNNVDEEKSKFKIGEWITDGEYTWKVTDIKPLDYILQSQAGSVISDDISYVDEHFNLWTIEDAKDGDVLAQEWNQDNDIWEKILIFKALNDNGVEGYGNTFKNKDLFFTDEKVPYYSKTWSKYLCPATKEQRNILFQKMKEEGYEWDAEKKELRKIERKSVEWNYPYVENETVDKLIAIAECLEMDGDCEFNGYTGTECGKFLRDLARKQVECKPAWNEDDERMIETIIYDLERHGGKEDSSYSVEINWLKSLKDKAQPQSHQEWSEDDEIKFRDVIRLVEQGAPVQQIRDHYTNWLKSLKDRFQLQPKQEWSEEDNLHLKNAILAAEKEWGLDSFTAKWLKSIIKPQNKWKPSEDQMIALRWVLNNIPYNYHKEVISQMVEQLKKL